MTDSKLSRADAPQPGGAPLVAYDELARHTSRDSLWVLVGDVVYDVTGLLDSHPGGTGPLLKWAGKNATKAFAPIHPPGTLETLPREATIGKIDQATIPRAVEEMTPEEKKMKAARDALPPVQAVLNLAEIEALAEGVLSATAWGYYRSAGDDENTFDENRRSFKQWWFRPRVLHKITNTDTTCRIFGHASLLPIWAAPAALARLGHPDGEMNIVRAAGKEGIVYSISSNASCSTEEIMSARQPGQNLVFQLYVNRDRAATTAQLPKLRSQGYSALMVTVDAAVAGNRERDQRAKGGEFVGPARGKSDAGGGAGVALAISGYQDPDVAWEDIPWIQSLTDLPIYVKGIQCVEDAATALEVYKVQGIILSNHGGRSLDYAPPPMAILQELRAERPELLDRHEVHIDGGVTRGTDVLKALCLGARGVGLGRAFLYGNALWGEEGCRRTIEIMRNEIITGMRLMGVTRIEQLRPELVRWAMNSLSYLSRQLDVLATKSAPNTPRSELPPPLASSSSSGGDGGQARKPTWSLKSLVAPPAPRRSLSSPALIATRAKDPPPPLKPAPRRPSARRSSLRTKATSQAGGSVARRMLLVRVIVLVWQAMCAAVETLGGALTMRWLWAARANEPTCAEEKKPLLADKEGLPVPPFVVRSPTDPSIPVVNAAERAHIHLFSPETAQARVSRTPSPNSASGLPIPPRRTPFHLPKTLVLDLDETLIHSTSRPLPSFNSGLLGLSLGRRDRPHHEVEVTLGGRSTTYHVYKRPFVDYFLRKVSSWYTLVIFTASMQEYADPVIDWLDAGTGILSRRLFRESCTQLPNGSYSKDLSIVEADLARVALLDNSPISYSINETNGIPIEGWTHDPHDEALLDLLPILDSLRFTSDVRRVLGLRGFSIA
ncbi:unnamed protein product [Peniophora sp. CBMAI 1063]|nr:unnamed protein product [Peniophora sp. CBMAI 1063]